MDFHNLQSADVSTAHPPTAAETSPEQPWPLRLLSEKLKAHIDRAPAAWVEGQIIEIHHRANASYLTLRDMEAEISLNVTLFSSVRHELRETLEHGARVVAQLKPDFWVKTGRLSMIGRQIRPVGVGDLLLRIEALRKTLTEEGLFAPERKQALPLLPQLIGLITGHESDAMKDVLRNARRRWPTVRFLVRETAVQGSGSVAQITSALAELDAHPDVDVIVIARGGGSLEDLLGFSDEALVRAVAAARTPVVSAIGHEADRPLLDEVADLRASTPTDAAKRLVPDLAEELQLIAEVRERLAIALRQILQREQERLDQLRSRPAFADPISTLKAFHEDNRLLRHRAFAAITALVQRHQDAITHLGTQITTLSPQNTLDRGYAVLREENGHIVTSSQQAPPGKLLKVRVASGSFWTQSQGEQHPRSSQERS